MSVSVPTHADTHLPKFSGKKEEFEDWLFCMRSFIEAKGLRHIIEQDGADEEISESTSSEYARRSDLKSQKTVSLMENKKRLFSMIAMTLNMITRKHICHLKTDQPREA